MWKFDLILMPYLSFKKFNPLGAGSLEIKIKSLRLKLIFTYFCQKMISFPYNTRHLDEKKGLKVLFRLNIQILHLADLIGL